MIVRTFRIAASAAAFGLGLAATSPVEAAGLWGIVANGTRLDGITVEALTPDCIRMHGTEEVQFWNRQTANGTQLSGSVLQGVTFESIRTLEYAKGREVARGGLCQAEGICPKNGTRLTGVALAGVTLNSIQLLEWDEADQLQSAPAARTDLAPGTAPSSPASCWRAWRR